jgi:anti-sigma B factor antagonist
MQPPHGELLTVAVDDAGGVVVVRLTGELDIATAPQADAGLAQAEARSPAALAVDLSGLAFMDSSGLRVIVGALMRGRAGGWPVSLVAPTGPVRQMLALQGLDRALPIVDRVGDVAGGAGAPAEPAPQ